MQPKGKHKWELTFNCNSDPYIQGFDYTDLNISSESMDSV